jgi:hypothetical protein
VTDRDALIHRIAGAIARKTASAAPAEVLAELSTTHVLVERERWERVWTYAQTTAALNDMIVGRSNDWAGMQALADQAKVEYGALHPGDLDPVAASDTTET